MNCLVPDQPYNGILCFITGYEGARWYRALDLDPPKVHPIAAFIHGVASSAITSSVSYLLDKTSPRIASQQALENRMREIVSWTIGVIAARVLTNYLNLNYLKLNRIGNKTISLKPISLRDSFLMEAAALSLYLSYSGICFLVKAEPMQQIF